MTQRQKWGFPLCLYPVCHAIPVVHLWYGVGCDSSPPSPLAKLGWQLPAKQPLRKVRQRPAGHLRGPLCLLNCHSGSTGPGAITAVHMTHWAGLYLCLKTPKATVSDLSRLMPHPLTSQQCSCSSFHAWGCPLQSQLYFAVWCGAEVHATGRPTHAQPVRENQRAQTRTHTTAEADPGSW